MTDEQLYCDAPGCDDPLNPGFPRPVAGHGRGKCSSHMKQLQRTGRTTVIAEKLNQEERAIKLGTAFLESDDDGDYERNRTAFLSACIGLGQHARTAALKKGFERAKRRGVRLGRPPKVSLEEVLRVYSLLGSVTATARVLRLSKSAVSERLASVRKPRVSEPRSTRGPRLAG
jgi:hypothetical protein